jgi:hypothetical protein
MDDTNSQSHSTQQLAAKGPDRRTAFDTTAFQHKPLDHTKATIRLLKILPDLSDTGLIQCHMWHDNVDAQYDCLSYVWGSDQDDQAISLNGKDYRLRKNLWDFLSVARINGLKFKAYFLDRRPLYQSKFHRGTQPSSSANGLDLLRCAVSGQLARFQSSYQACICILCSA